MRIGIDARILQNERRGQGQYLYYLIKNLLKIDRRNEYVIFYNSFKRGKFVFEDTFLNLKQVWCRIPGRMLKPLWSGFDFPPIESLVGDIQLFHSPFNFNFTHYTPIPSKAKMVVTFNGMADPSTIWEHYDLQKINRWFRLVAQRAAMVIAVSDSVKADLLSRVDIPDNKIKVVYYGVSEEFKLIEDKARLEPVLSKYGLRGKRYILYVGAAEKNKNLSGLLKAFSRICDTVDLNNLYLVLAGKINEVYRNLMEESRQLGIRQKVIFTDYIGHEFLPFIYNGAELFVLPTFNEWFGIPLLEAMACGTAVAASNCRGIPEVVNDAALLFNPDDIEEMVSVMGSILRNKELQLNLRQKGLRRVENFTWEKTAQRTLEIYLEAINK